MTQDTPGGGHDWDAEPPVGGERLGSSQPGGAEHEKTAEDLGVPPTSDWEAGPSLTGERLRASKGPGNEPERTLARTGVRPGQSTPAEQSATPGMSEPARHEVDIQASGAIVTSNNPGAAPRFETAGPADEPASPNADRNAELRVSALFVLAALAAGGFPMVYFFLPQQDLAYTPLLGACLAIFLGGLGAGMVLWSKILMPHEEVVQEREQLYSRDVDKGKTAAAFEQGIEMVGIKRRSILKRALGLAGGLALLPALTPILSLGSWQNKEKQLARTAWRKGTRLVTEDNLPIRVGTLQQGGFITVFPEGRTEEANSATLLIRLPPGANRPLPGRADWAPENHVAYSKICTHAGCPIGLVEHQTHHMLCPCHQSTFQADHGAEPIFGPAARPLPQLPLEIDEDGYLRAQSGYHEPIGPSYWTRG